MFVSSRVIRLLSWARHLTNVCIFGWGWGKQACSVLLYRSSAQFVRLTMTSLSGPFGMSWIFQVFGEPRCSWSTTPFRNSWRNQKCFFSPNIDRSSIKILVPVSSGELLHRNFTHTKVRTICCARACVHVRLLCFQIAHVVHHVHTQSRIDGLHLVEVYESLNFLLLKISEIVFLIILLVFSPQWLHVSMPFFTKSAVELPVHACARVRTNRPRHVPFSPRLHARRQSSKEVACILTRTKCLDSCARQSNSKSMQ